MMSLYARRRQKKKKTRKHDYVPYMLDANKRHAGGLSCPPGMCLLKEHFPFVFSGAMAWTGGPTHISLTGSAVLSL